MRRRAGGSRGVERGQGGEDGLWRASYTCYTLFNMKNVKEVKEVKGVKQLNVRAPEAEMQLWKDAAWERKVSLSEWVRKVLTATAQATVSERDE